MTSKFFYASHRNPMFDQTEKYVLVKEHFYSKHVYSETDFSLNLERV